MNNILVHCHIAKTGGTTIEWSLKKNFGSRHVRQTSNIKKISHDDFLDFLHENPHIVSVSSHHFLIPEGVTGDTRINTHPFVFLRHPVDRLVSLYLYLRNIPHGFNNVIHKAKTLSLEEFCRDKANNPNASLNGYIRILNARQVPDNLNLDYFFDNLRSRLLFGITERFDESCVVLEEHLKEFFPNIDFSYVKKRINTSRQDTLEKRMYNLQDKIGESLMHELYSIKKLDFDLYDKANKELDKNKNKIKKFDEKLINFKNRCENYHP